MEKLADAVTYLIDAAPIEKKTSSLREKLSTVNQFHKLAKRVNFDFAGLHEVITAPASKVLDKWFESEPLKACLATDAVIGAMLSPETPGSGYVLLHHVMGGVGDHKGAWAYVKGGMGGVSVAIAKSFKAAGGDIYCDSPIEKIEVDNGTVAGIKLENGSMIEARTVLANPTAKVTFEQLIDADKLPPDFLKGIKAIGLHEPL